MRHSLDIDHGPEPIRLFQSDFLEFFTHIHPGVIILIWTPVVVYFLAQPLLNPPVGTSLGFVPAAFLLGIFVWTFMEYMLHRFVFHYRPRSPWQARVVFLFHGVHHKQPQCKTRLVMPPVVSVPLAFVFYGLFYGIVAVGLGLPYWTAPLFSGAIFGYLLYDLTHYATHHLPMRRGLMRYLKRYHLKHHYKTPDQRFGVSSPLWDIVFGTKPAD